VAPPHPPNTALVPDTPTAPSELGFSVAVATDTELRRDEARQRSGSAVRREEGTCRQGARHDGAHYGGTSQHSRPFQWSCRTERAARAQLAGYSLARNSLGTRETWRPRRLFPRPISVRRYRLFTILGISQSERASRIVPSSRDHGPTHSPLPDRRRGGDRWKPAGASPIRFPRRSRAGEIN
jgi:hypothetical protein